MDRLWTIREVANLPPCYQDQRRTVLLPDGLTALHRAVLQSDRARIQRLLASSEHHVEERTSTGATPIMLACLFGRADVFFELRFKYKADLKERDGKHFTAQAYTRQGRHFPTARELVVRYHRFAGAPASRSGRKVILRFLKSLRDNAEAPGPPAQAPEAQRLFLHTRGVFEAVRVERLAVFEIDQDLGRKTCGGIRAQNEEQYRAIAISGWAGFEAKRVVNVDKLLNNAEYMQTTRTVGAMFGYKFQTSPFDGRFQGTPSERAGVYHACHAEKQLAVFVVQDLLGQTLGSKAITVENVAKLKEKGPRTSFIIELEHKPCSCCLAFLKLIGHKSGLQFDWRQLEWFARGQRPRLRYWQNCTVRASAQDVDAFEDEMDVGEGVDILSNPDDGEESDSTMVGDGDARDDGWGVVDTPHGNEVAASVESPCRKIPSSGTRRQKQQREYPIPRKEGSAVLDQAPSRPNRTKHLDLREMEKTSRRRQITSPNAASASPGAHRRLDSEMPIRSSPSNKPSLRTWPDVSQWRAEATTSHASSSAVREPFPGASLLSSTWAVD